MNELLSFEEGYEQSVERTKQHFFAIHAQIRIDMLSTMTEIDRVSSIMSLNAEPQMPADSSDNKRKPPSKDMKETYRRICNLCHPDKTGKNDVTHTRLMHEAKAALKARDADLLEKLYDQVMFYNNNPDAYVNIVKQSAFELARESDPWFEVYEHHLRGETKDAFYKSRQILGQLLVQRRADLTRIKSLAQCAGIQV